MPDPNPNRDSRGRFAPKFGVVLTVSVIGVSLAVATGSSGAGIGGAAGAGAVADAPSLSVQARSTRGNRRSERTRQSLLTRGIRGEVRAQRDSTSCSADARGQVREFLATHRCESVYRASFVVRKGNVAGVVAVAWIDMAEVDDATALKALVDRPGTGNVNQLPLPPSQRPIEVVNPAYASGQRGRLVVTVEAEPLAVTRDQRVLESLAEQAANSADDQT
jgi:hypothetical protein